MLLSTVLSIPQSSVLLFQVITGRPFSTFSLQSKLEPAQYHSHPSITRYFDHIQSRPSVRKSAETLASHPLVTFDLENAPKLERVADPPKKKEKAPKADAAPASAPQEATAKEGGKQQNTEKKEKKKEKAAAQPQEPGKKADKKGGGKAPAADEGEPVPSMIDLRVGHILDGMFY